MDRSEAISLLRDLIANNLVEPSFVHLIQREPNHCQLQIKNDYFRSEIEAYAKKLGLSLKEDPEKKYLLIFKP
ncbi:MAG TPA: hypothetical protein VLU95_00055 [Candidatus Acidoferrum sp.]|nr:hypothetical protein [Candidatus Acidoferrum sp.]